MSILPRHNKPSVTFAGLLAEIRDLRGKLQVISAAIEAREDNTAVIERLSAGCFPGGEPAGTAGDSTSGGVR